MSKVLVVLLFLVSCSVSGNEAAPWVLKYVSWSNWGASGNVWLNSNMSLVVSDGDNYKNIPCESNVTDGNFNEIDKLVQELIIKNPRSSGNTESKTCFDETRVSLTITLKPDVSEEHGEFQSFLMERFSPVNGCNEKEVDELWLKLVNQLDNVKNNSLDKCVNHPF